MFNNKASLRRNDNKSNKEAKQLLGMVDEPQTPEVKPLDKTGIKMAGKQ